MSINSAVWKVLLAKHFHLLREGAEEKEEWKLNEGFKLFRVFNGRKTETMGAELLPANTFRLFFSY